MNTGDDSVPTEVPTGAGRGSPQVAGSPTSPGIQHDGTLDFKTWLSLNVMVFCGVCFDPYDPESKKPITGRCGHSICEECNSKHVLMGISRPDQFMPCPAPGCAVAHSFPRCNVPSLVALECMSKLKEVQDGVLHTINNALQDVHTKDMTIEALEDELFKAKAQLSALQFQMMAMAKFSGGVANPYKKHVISSNPANVISSYP